MHFQQIQTYRFRNLRDVSLELGSRFNLLIGENAQGKTNFLEAVALLSELRSFRRARSGDLLLQGESEGWLQGQAEVDELDYTVRLRLESGKLALTVNGKGVSKKKDYIGLLPTVVFTPEDVRLTTGEPERRRRFLDRTLFLLQPSHWVRVVEYKDVLRRRNSLLRERQVKDPLFEVYSEKLAKLGSAITQQRQELVASLQKQVDQAIEQVSSGKERVRLLYSSRWQGTDTESLSEQGEASHWKRLLQILEKQVDTDIERGWTSIGPHTEDLIVQLDGARAQRFASQGQNRSIALALKIAETEVLHAARGTYPVLLIDDLSSELDRQRRERLFRYLAGTAGQVILTSTDHQPAGNLKGSDLRLFHVQQGEIRQETPQT